MTESLKATDELGGRGATHPRVELKGGIEDRIVGEYYINAGTAVALDGVTAEGKNLDHIITSDNPLKLMTVCFLVIDNGFVEIGYSAPASPENFDADKGRQFARENAIRALWPKMGFALRERLAAEG